MEKKIEKLKKTGLCFKKISTAFKFSEYLFKINKKEFLIKYSKKDKLFNHFTVSSVHEIPIFKINEIRDGAKTDKFYRVLKNKIANDNEKDIYDKICFSLKFEKNTLNLIAFSQEDKETFIEVLNHILTKLNIKDISQKTNLWVSYLFHKRDKRKKEELTLKQCTKVLRDMNIPSNNNHIKQTVDKKSLNLCEFINYLKNYKYSEQIIQLYNRIRGSDCYITDNKLQTFFSSDQQESDSIRDYQMIIRSHEILYDSKLANNYMLSLDGFFKFLESDYMDIRNREHCLVYQDMNQPITKYFIDSSHNTYLLRRQILDQSSLETYIFALKSGCRCIELDVWDNVEGPQIYHGHAVTTKLWLKDVVKIILEYAFVTTRYPLILSIENHCSFENQIKMVQLFNEYFKDKLFTGPLEAGQIPSPEDLIDKIIIEDFGSSEDTRNDECLEDDNLDLTELKKLEIKNHPLYEKCIFIYKKDYLESLKNETAEFRCAANLNEDKARRLCDEPNLLTNFIGHNMNYISRIFPKFLTRIDSSNFNPNIFWAAGCQQVALNYQTPGRPMFFNQGMFADNGRSGYVLKPIYLRELVDSRVACPPRYKRINIEIISGYALPKKPKCCRKAILDPFVRISVTDAQGDIVEWETHVITNNGYNPKWNKSFCLVVQNPDICLILFEVVDGRTVVAQAAIRFTSIRYGYRIVHLNDIYGQSLISHLFVHIEESNR